MIGSGVILVVFLRAAVSRIIVNRHRINQGQMLKLEWPDEDISSVRRIEEISAFTDATKSNSSNERVASKLLKFSKGAIGRPRGKGRYHALWRAPAG